jgi:Superfamily II DNA/RNA helicases, SNF2 family
VTLLASHPWKLKYTPEEGDLIRQFYVPTLEDAVRYDRLTGYFNAIALALAARGIEGLVRNHGHMRLVVGCTLEPPEIEAIERGERLRDLVERHLAALPLAPPDSRSREALELLAWMVAQGILDVKVAVPCDEHRRPIPSDGLFHEKAGIIEDRVGDVIAWNGSLNETGAGWQYNWESINVYTSWGVEPKRVIEEQENFARIWANQSRRVITLDVPAAVREDLLRFMPADDRPARLKDGPVPPLVKKPTTVDQGEPEHPIQTTDRRRLIWGFIKHAPTLPQGGERVGEATCAVMPWPHQVRAFQRLYERWPPKLLIADEVGLGKTIQAGLLLRQAWLSGRARRILVLAPKAVLRQWQIELREKFNLNWPIYDGQKLLWYPSPAIRGREVQAIDRAAWHKQPVVIASSHLMRRQDRAAELLDKAEPWDLVVLDEAHHARRRAAGSPMEGGPNALLRLMQELKRRTQGLVLLTATPLQVHPVEVWDLLSLLGLPPEWNSRAFLQFFEDVEQLNPSKEAFERMAALFQATERSYGQIGMEEAKRITQLSRPATAKVLRALRDSASIPRRQLETSERAAAIRLLRATSPIRHLVSRHTRELLRRYYQAGRLSTPIADRIVEDRFIPMTPEEQALYEAVEGYISSTHNQASEKERNAVGFVMTIYRRRLASSFQALGHTLQVHLEAIADGSQANLLADIDEDAPEDETADEVIDADDAAELEQQALLTEEKADIESLLRRIKRLPPDTKLLHLIAVLDELRASGFTQVMVFTQYTDTMDFLRDELKKIPGLSLMCFSGRGGEVPNADGSWRVISRDEVKRRFRDQQAHVLLCTDAAAEGLNFQFCGALVNYDMPWNPMRVEQRIGRIDRLGQQYPKIRIINLHYEGTIEADVYQALRNRIGLFEIVVGRLQPILAQLPRTIAETVLAGTARNAGDRASLVSAIEQQSVSASTVGFDIDAITEQDLIELTRPAPLFTMEDLNRVIRSEAAMPPGILIEPLSSREYAYLAPGMKEKLWVTTDPSFYEEHAESVELWSPGSPLFPEPDIVATPDELTGTSLAKLVGEQ